MHQWLRTVLAGFTMLAAFVARPAAVSVEDLVNLKANGLSDDVLIALIESDGSVFRLSAADVVVLHRRGLAEKVLLAMIATSRVADVPHADVDHPERRASDEPAKPVEVHVHQSVVQQAAAPVAAPDVVFVPVPVAVSLPVVMPVRPAPPVFWGFGGSARPGAWKPAHELDRRPGSDPVSPKTR